MAVVSADSLQFSHVAEVTPGVTPATPAFKVFRLTGESLVFSPNVSESAELGGSGRSQKPGNVTGMEVSGDVNFELAPFPALEEAIAGVFGAEWGQCPLTGLPGGGIDNTNRITVGNALKTFTVEKRFVNPNYVEGAMPISAVIGTPAPAAAVAATFSGGASTGSGAVVVDLAVDNLARDRFSVVVDPADDELAVVTKLVAVIDASSKYTASDGGAGLLNIGLEAGTSITTFDVRTGENRYYYQRFIGSSYSVLNLTTSPNNPVTGSFSVVGGVPDLDDLPITGATYATAGTNPVFTAPQVLELTVGTALSLGANCWTSLDMTFDSQNRGIPCIGTQGDREVVLGTMAISITGDVYFSDQEILEALLANQSMGDSIMTFVNADGALYRFDLYDMKPVSGEVAAGGQGEDLTIPVEFQPAPKTVCESAGTPWTSGVILSKENTAPPIP